MKKRKNKNILKKVSQLRFFCGIIGTLRKNIRKDRSSMESGAFGMLKRIYGATSTPVAILNADCVDANCADRKYNILWKNPAAEASELFDGNFAALLCGSGEPSDGAVSVFMNGAYRLFNVMKCDADDGCLIIEYTGIDHSRDISHMKDYFIFLVSRLRESASQISMSAYEIDMFVKNGETEIASQLNRIDRNVMLLLRETIVPEHLFYAADPYCKDESLNLAEAVAVVAADTERILGRLSYVEQNAENSVCAAINKGVFEAVLALMTAESCCGDFFPERVEFAVERDSENDRRASVSVRSICLSDRKNAPMSLEPLKKNEFFTETAFKAVLAEKHGAEFEKKHHSDGIEYIMTLDVLPESKRIVKGDSRAIPMEDRFSSTAVSLSEKHYGERYKNIKMN